MKTIIISLIAVFTLLGSFDAQAQIPPDASVQQALVTAMWQGIEKPNQTNSIIFGIVGLILLGVSIPLGKTAFAPIGVAAAITCLVGAIASYGGNNAAVTNYQKVFEARAERIAEMLGNPEIEIVGAVETKDGVSVDLWLKSKTSKRELSILGKNVEVVTVEKEAKVATLTPLMLANLAPLNIKIAGQPINELIAKR